MIKDFIFLLIGVLAAVICLANGLSSQFTLICSFLPILISILVENIEKINLFFSKLALLNKTVSIKVSVKNIFVSKKGAYVDPTFYEELFRKTLIEKNVSVGNENNFLRIEGNQKVSYGKDKNINVKVPVLILLQFDGTNIICTFRNSSESIAYRDIHEMIRDFDSIWDFLNDQVKDTFNCEQRNAYYEAKIKLNTSKFKDVYLKSYAQKWVGNIILKRYNALVNLEQDAIIISSNSELSFEKAIKKYSGLFENFFKEEG